jgi:hypothetical protein
MTTLRDDHQTQAAVLNLVLIHAPHLLTEQELINEIAGPSSDFADRDDAQRAIRDLANSGVLHRIGGGIVQITNAARQVSELLGP